MFNNLYNKTGSAVLLLKNEMRRKKKFYRVKRLTFRKDMVSNYMASTFKSNIR